MNRQEDHRVDCPFCWPTKVPDQEGGWRTVHDTFCPLYNLEEQE